MRSVILPGTELSTSCLGMGCASLGSRVSAKSGLKALAEAYDYGVRWYDVAPAYGAGRAEGILSQFLESRRSDVSICTKVGLLPPNRNWIFQQSYNLARPLFSKALTLRRLYRSMPSTRNVRTSLSAATIVDSLEGSLRRLGTDYLDVFALHDPRAADIGRDEIVRCLEDCVRRGLVRYVSVAGDEECQLKAANIGFPYTISQIANPLGSSLVSRLLEHKNGVAPIVLHSVLGLGGDKDRLLNIIKSHHHIERDLRDLGFKGNPDELVTHFLIARAFSCNPAGVVLLSMFRRGRVSQASLIGETGFNSEINSVCLDIAAIVGSSQGPTA